MLNQHYSLAHATTRYFMSSWSNPYMLIERPSSSSSAIMLMQPDYLIKAQRTDELLTLCEHRWAEPERVVFNSRCNVTELQLKLWIHQTSRSFRRSTFSLQMFCDEGVKPFRWAPAGRCCVSTWSGRSAPPVFCPDCDSWWRLRMAAGGRG